MAAVQREVERKYDVGEDAAVPSLHELPGVGSVRQPVEHQLAATYFDTPDLALARNRITLRRRSGGKDAGWHLKRPLPGGDRQELHAPLGRSATTVPEALLSQVRVHVRDRAPQPVVRLRTRRVVHDLLGGDGTVLAELADDYVAAEPLDGAGGPSSWREWEFELVEGDRSLLEAAEPVLLAAGAKPASGPSKLARVLGNRVSARADEEPPTEDGPAGAVLLMHLAEQVAELKTRDPLVRNDEPDSVHKMRVATRRLRSALRTFRPLLDRGVTDPLREELKWLATVLGAARDAEVMRERLLELVAAEPPELVLGGVTRRVEVELLDTYRTAHDRVLEALDTERYFRLLDALDALVREPPWTELADGPAAAVLPRLVRRAWRRLRRDAAAADAAADPEQRDHLLHEVRKSAKRARYAGEALAPVFGDSAADFAKAAERAQEVLGEHQDSVVTRALLRQLAVQAHLAGENAFTYGRLHALEQRHGEVTAAAYVEAWDDLSARSLRRWLRR